MLQPPGESSVPQSKRKPLMYESFTPSFSHRSAAIPNKKGTKAVYTINTQTPGSHANITETRIIDLLTGTSTLFSNDPRDKEAKWLGKGNLVLWLKDVDFGATEFWVADAEDARQNNVNLISKRASVGSSCAQPAIGYCAGRINARAAHLKLHRLHNQYDDIAIAVACSATSNGSLYNPDTEGFTSEISNAIWYTTLRKKAMDNSTTNLKYITSPTRFVNALRGTGLESPLRSPFGKSTDFDISTSGIVFLAREEPSSATQPANVNVNVYYIPLKTFTEMSRPRPQIIDVKGFGGRSSKPLFSPSGDSVAFLKKRDLADSNDRKRVIMVNNIRDFRAHMAIDDMPTQQSEKDWYLSPYSVAWSDNGEELYVVAVEAGIRRLFKIPAALSSIRTTPEPVTSDSTTPADVRHLRMVFSALLDISSERSSLG